MLNITIYKIERDNIVAQEAIKKEGACKNQLLIISRDLDLTPESRKTLSQILNAIKYNLEDSCMLVLGDAQLISINSYVRQYAIQKVISFGISPKDIGLQINPSAYRLIEMEALKLVFSHKISSLNSDKQKKIKLWNTLQTL
ncbi:MAG: hypothetical protein P8N29_07680 [Saprospiraceae bacterium]|nr:hypothetical protein [Saprospiraceae bacterium]